MREGEIEIEGEREVVPFNVVFQFNYLYEFQPQIVFIIALSTLRIMYNYRINLYVYFQVISQLNFPPTCEKIAHIFV